MSDRDDTPENRRAWIDRSRLLRGPAAMEALDLKSSAAPPRQTFGSAPGPSRTGCWMPMATRIVARTT